MGSESTNVLNFANNLALGYHSLGRYAESVALDEETLRISEQVLGPEHPDTLLGSKNPLQNSSWKSNLLIQFCFLEKLEEHARWN